MSIENRRYGITAIVTPNVALNNMKAVLCIG